MNDSNQNERDVMNVTTDGEIPPENKPVHASRPSGPSVTPDQHFLNKFLEEKQQASEAGDKARADMPVPDSRDALHEQIVTALREIYDPEIPVNIYEMGLIYSVEIFEDLSVDITMTLTTPHCPVAETMPGEVEAKAMTVPGVKSCKVKLVWEPVWDMSFMSDEARLELGLL